MADVTLTAALRSNLLSLQGTQKLLDSTQLRLATGKKVNSALDNANSYFASRALTFRASDLSNLLDGMGQAIQVLKAADQGITSLTGLVEQAQSIAQGARDTTSLSGLARSGDFTQAGTTATTFTAGTVAMSNNGATAVTLTITAGMSLSQVAAAINNLTGFSAQLVDVSAPNQTNSTFTGGKRLEIRATGGSLTMTIGGGTNFLTVLESGIGAGAVTGSVGGGAATTAIATGATIAATQNSTEQVTSEKQYEAIRTQINQLIADTGYRGTNLLNGDTMVTKFNESGSSSQSIVGVTYNAAGLGMSGVAETATAAGGFASSTTIDNIIAETKSALNSLRAQAKAFGNNLTVIQTRQDFTSNLVNTLKEGSDKLTLADKNEEGANLLSLQTSQELGITALSLASQASQSVLRLFS